MVGHQGDYSTDYQWWDNVESLSGSMPRAGAVTQTFSTTYAFRGDISGDAPSYLGAELQENSQVWSIPAASVGTYELLRGDTLTDSSSVVWVVDQATLVTLGTSKLFWLATTHRKQHV